MAKASDGTIVIFQRQPGQCPVGVKSAVLTVERSLPVFPDQRTFSEEVRISQKGQEPTCFHRDCFNRKRLANSATRPS